MKKYVKAFTAACMMISLCGCQIDYSESNTTSKSTSKSIKIGIDDFQTDEVQTNAWDNTDSEAKPSTESTLSEPEKLMQKLTLHQKVCQMFMIRPEQVTSYEYVTIADEPYKNGIMELPVGGIVMYDKNLSSYEQTAQFNAYTQSFSREACGVGMFTAIDEEGGAVARAAKSLGTTSFNGMRYYGDMRDAAVTFDVGKTIGTDISSLGFNVDFAPVADVAINGYNELGNRIFSSDPDVVAEMVSAFVKGIHESGVCATLKHFPGLGAEDGNTHYDSSVMLYRSVEELHQTEFVPFISGIAAGADFVMVGHQKISSFGDDLPSDLSYTAVTTFLRNELGFGGLIMTDSHEMTTIANDYGSGTAAVMAVEAGVDIILMPQDLRAAVSAVEQAVNDGTISQERIDRSVKRILDKKYEMGLF